MIPSKSWKNPREKMKYLDLSELSIYQLEKEMVTHSSTLA